jgi:hypothetical protein
MRAQFPALAQLTLARAKSSSFTPVRRQGKLDSLGCRSDSGAGKLQHVDAAVATRFFDLMEFR